jgi:hypothetical protein
MTNILELFTKLFYKLFVFKDFLPILTPDFLAGMLLAFAANCRCTNPEGKKAVVHFFGGFHEKVFNFASGIGAVGKHQCFGKFHR